MLFPAQAVTLVAIVPTCGMSLAMATLKLLTAQLATSVLPRSSMLPLHAPLENSKLPQLTTVRLALNAQLASTALTRVLSPQSLAQILCFA